VGLPNIVATEVTVVDSASSLGGRSLDILQTVKQQFILVRLPARILLLLVTLLSDLCLSQVTPRPISSHSWRSRYSGTRTTAESHALSADKSFLTTRTCASRTRRRTVVRESRYSDCQRFALFKTTYWNHAITHFIDVRGHTQNPGARGPWGNWLSADAFMFLELRTFPEAPL
jgi:hypothetical protein